MGKSDRADARARRSRAASSRWSRAPRGPRPGTRSVTKRVSVAAARRRRARRPFLAHDGHVGSRHSGSPWRIACTTCLQTVIPTEQARVPEALPSGRIHASTTGSACSPTDRVVVTIDAARERGPANVQADEGWRTGTTTRVGAMTRPRPAAAGGAPSSAADPCHNQPRSSQACAKRTKLATVKARRPASPMAGKHRRRFTSTT